MALETKTWSILITGLGLSIKIAHFMRRIESTCRAQSEDYFCSWQRRLLLGRGVSDISLHQAPVWTWRIETTNSSFAYQNSQRCWHVQWEESGEVLQRETWLTERAKPNGDERLNIRAQTRAKNKVLASLRVQKIYPRSTLRCSYCRVIHDTVYVWDSG